MDLKSFQELEEGNREDEAHAKSDIHIQLCEAEVAAVGAVQAGLIVQQLQ